MGKGKRGQLRIYLGAPRGRQDLRDARRGAPAGRARHRRGRRLRRDPRPAADRGAARRPGGRPPPDGSSYRGADVRGDGPRRGARPQARRSRWSTSSRTPTSPARGNAKRWQDVEELLRRRHRRDLHGQHPAPGVAQRRRREDHRRAAARDGARRGGARRRPGRAGRHDARGAAPPDGARQRLRRRRRSTPRWPTTSGSATSPRCASWRCCGWPTGSTRACSATAAAARHRRHLGDPGAGRGRADRRPGGRHADPPGRPDRRPLRRRRPARRARHPQSTG